MKLKFGDPVEILWVDACSTAGWHEPYEDGVVIKTVGIFVQQNKKGLCYAKGVDETDKETVMAPSFIPKGFLRKVRRLR